MKITTTMYGFDMMYQLVSARKRFATLRARILGVIYSGTFGNLLHFVSRFHVLLQTTFGLVTFVTLATRIRLIFYVLLPNVFDEVLMTECLAAILTDAGLACMNCRDMLME